MTTSALAPVMAKNGTTTERMLVNMLIRFLVLSWKIEDFATGMIWEFVQV